jgi:class 3 adenylate cyclase
MRGAWAEAEKEALKARQELIHLYAFAASAIYEVGEIRLRLGDLDGAEQAFKEAHALGFHSQPGLAMLYEAQGKSKAACEMLESVLSEISLPLKRVPMISALGMLAVRSNKKELAQSLSTELSHIAENFNSEAINASALNLSGLLAYLNGDYESALDAFRSTLKYWLDARLPYEIAHARLNIANTFAKMGHTELARLEWETALGEFERLGAKPEMEKVRMAIARKSDQASSVEKKALMFTDIVGSTALISIIGDSAWKHLVQWHDRILRTLFERHLGREVDHAGDGFFVSFDTPQDAILCAQEIQRTLLKHRTTQGFAPNVRIGIHCAQVSYSDSTIVGLEVHKAARIASLADAGQIVASFEMACDLDASLFGERKTATIKGITEPIEVVMVEWKEG